MASSKQGATIKDVGSLRTKEAKQGFDLG